MGDLDASVAETQKVLQAIISKPKLTEALLKKPPFRFLHDIVSEVKKQTGFPPLADADLDSNNCKDKESKIAYLTKVIGMVTEVTGPITVKPQKIVAGMEPENTNALLQGLAKASSSAGGAAPAPAPSPPKPAPAPKKEEAAPPPEPKPERPKPKPQEDEGGAEPAADERPGKSRGERARKAPAPEQEASTPPAAEPKRAPPPPAAAHPEPAPEDESVQRRMDRPRTARRAPPKVNSNVAPKDTRPSSKQSESRGAVARVIAEGDDDGDDDDDDVDGALGAAQIGGGSAQPKIQGDGEHGMLVKNMLKQEEQIVSKEGDKHQDKRESLASQEHNKERQRTVEEMTKLRDAIQSLCQSTNPLARSMDYVQEDLDNMGKELDFWSKDKVAQSQKLDEEEKRTEQELEALVSTLRGVEQEIMEEELRINDMKGSVLRNEMTIRNMLGSVVRDSGGGQGA